MPIKAVAVLKGNLNGSPVVGTIRFIQPVSLSYFDFLVLKAWF